MADQTKTGAQPGDLTEGVLHSDQDSDSAGSSQSGDLIIDKGDIDSGKDKLGESELT